MAAAALRSHLDATGVGSCDWFPAHLHPTRTESARPGSRPGFNLTLFPLVRFFFFARSGSNSPFESIVTESLR